MVRLKATLIGRILADKQIRSMVREFANAADAFVQQLEHDAINRFSQRFQ